MRYNAWANETLFEACRHLTDAQLEHSLDVTSGTTKELLTHIVGGQQTYVLRTQGRQHEGELTRDSSWPGIESLIDIVKQTSNELIEIAQRLDPEAEIDLPY